MLGLRVRKVYNMINIHIHLIPAVDDGAEDQNVSLLMLLRAKEQGVTHIFATPHSSAFAEVAIRKYRMRLFGDHWIRECRTAAVYGGK